MTNWDDWGTSNVTRSYRPPYQYQPPRKYRRKGRVFRWFFLGQQLLFVAWIISGLANTSKSHETAACKHEVYVNACKAGFSIGRGVGIAAVIALWIAADIIVGLTYLIWRHFTD